jgi:hypothetical protein
LLLYADCSCRKTKALPTTAGMHGFNELLSLKLVHIRKNVLLLMSHIYRIAAADTLVQKSSG